MSFVDFKAVKAAVPIDDAVRKLGLKLKPSGQQLRGQCPACQSEDDRALAVTPSKGLFYCHAAQSGGDVISLAAHILGAPVKDAAEWLADTLPHTREPTEPQKPEPRTAQAQPGPPPAREFDPDAYLSKLAYTEEVSKLGISQEDAARLGIGYCSTGLHRGRIVFPVRNPDGSISGFVGVQGSDLKLPSRWITPLEEVGKRFGITRERVRQIEAKAHEQIRLSIEEFRNQANQHNV